MGTPHLHTTPVDSGVEVAIRDGAAILRPLGPHDDDVLDAVFAGLSFESRASRFLVPTPRLTTPARRALLAVDGRRHVAWAAYVDGRPAGIARWVILHDDLADLAVEVVDEHQGRGLGAALFDTITTAAQAAGVRRLQVTLLATNHRTRRLVKQLGLTLRPVDGLLEGEGPFHLMTPARVERSSVIRLALAH